MLPHKNLWAPQSTHECAMDETHGWSNHETGSLIAIWGEESNRQQTIPLPAISIITEGNDSPIPWSKQREKQTKSTSIFTV